MNETLINDNAENADLSIEDLGALIESTKPLSERYTTLIEGTAMTIVKEEKRPLTREENASDLELESISTSKPIEISDEDRLRQTRNLIDSL
jgi:hypothetical protein